MRYRSAAMAEFWRALKTLKALQAEQADMIEQPAGADLVRETPVVQLSAPAPVRAQPPRPAAHRANADRRGPNEPERLMAYVLPEPPMAGPALHEPAASAAPRTERTLSCGSVAWRWGAHPVHGVGARGRRSERTQGLSPSLSMIPPPRFF